MLFLVAVFFMVRFFMILLKFHLKFRLLTLFFTRAYRKTLKWVRERNAKKGKLYFEALDEKVGLYDWKVKTFTRDDATIRESFRFAEEKRKAKLDIRKIPNNWHLNSKVRK